MPKASDLKKGDIVAIERQPHQVEQLSISTPSARGASSLYHIRFRNLSTKNKLDRTCKGDDAFDPCEFSKQPVQFSYRQDDAITFMNTEDFSEVVLNESDIAEELQFITDDMEGIQLLVADSRVIGLELPPVTELEITECDPSIRGASATARTKTALVSTGYSLQVPEYLEQGEVIRVDTRSGEFLGRA